VIEANFLVRHDDDFLTNQDVDRAGTRIAVSERSAYDLWLTDHFSQAQIIRASSIQAAHDLFLDKKVNVLASLKPKLLEEVANHSGLRMMPPFTAVKQSIGLAKGKAESIAFINALIAQSIENGWIAAQLETHGMTRKLGIEPH
jgi:polar amino acid transport system substrate-binding protein